VITLQNGVDSVERLAPIGNWRLLNKQVAAELGLSEITVRVHRGNVTRKWELNLSLTS
jgi:hypothetical protein